MRDPWLNSDHEEIRRLRAENAELRQALTTARREAAEQALNEAIDWIADNRNQSHLVRWFRADKIAKGDDE